MSEEGAAKSANPLAWLARRPLATLAVFCLVLWTPGVFSLPPLDRDESRFAQSSKQMLESGNFVDIRFGQVPRYKKPVGIYWLQALTTEVAGLGQRGHIWTYRLASLLGGIAAVWLTFWCAIAFASAEAAWLGAALLGATLLLTAEATIATTDAVLLACTLGAQGALLRIYLAARDATRTAPARATVFAGWAALGLGMLVKGPVVFVASGATIVGLSLWDRDWRWLKGTRPLTGLPLAILIVAPWAVAIALASHGQFYQQSLGADFAAKLAGGQETHGAPPGYYLALLSLTLWPATLFLIPAIGDALERRTEPAVRFLLVWAALSWLLLELVPTKLPHYILPVYPALAMLGSAWALRLNTGRWLVILGAIQFLLGVAAFALAPIVLPRLYGSGSTVMLDLLAGIGAAAGVAAAVFLLRGNPLAAVSAALGAAFLLYITLTMGVAPGLARLWVSPRVAGLVAKDSHANDPPPTLAGYEEPSLVFLLGTETRLTDGEGAASITADAGGLAVVEDHERGSFLRHLAGDGGSARAVDATSGLNYSRGKPVHITIYRVTPAPTQTAPPAE